MNIFRSLARGILNGLRVGRPVDGDARAQDVPPVVDEFDPAPVSAALKVVRADRFESSFTPASSQGDSFERAERAAPVDLSGGVKVHYTLVEDSSAAAAPSQEFFAASLDDLDLSQLPQGEGAGQVAEVEASNAAVEAEAESAAVSEPAAAAEPAAVSEPAVAPSASPRAEPVADSGFVASVDDLASLPAPVVADASSGFFASLDDLGLLSGPHPEPLLEGEEKKSAHDVELEALLLLPKPD